MNIKELHIEIYNQNNNEWWNLVDIHCNDKIYLKCITKDKITTELQLSYDVCSFYRYIHSNYIWNNVYAGLYTVNTHNYLYIKIGYKHLKPILSYLDYKFPMYLI